MTTSQTHKTIGHTTFVCHADEQVDNLRALSQVFEVPLLTVGAHHHPPGRIHLNDGQAIEESTNLTLAADVENLNEVVASLDLLKTDLHLRIYVDNLLLSRREEVVSTSFDALGTFNSWEIPKSTQALHSRRGFDIRLIAYLQTPSEASVRWGTNPGTWVLAHKFEVRPLTAAFRFAPHPLNKEIRTALGISRDALSHVQLSGDVLDCDSLVDITDVYIDEEVLELLAEAPDSAASLSFQVLFAAQVLTAIIGEITVKLNETKGSLPANFDRSGAGRLLRDVAISNGLQVHELVDTLLQDSSRSSTYVQSLLQARKRVALAVREMV